MINIADMKWLHNVLKGASLTTALFVFQACYGTPVPDMYLERGAAPMTFALKSSKDGKPLEGVRITTSTNPDNGFHEVGVTGEDGTCRVELIYARNVEGPFIRFEEPEGKYQPKDTTLADLRDRTVLVKLDPAE